MINVDYLKESRFNLINRAVCISDEHGRIPYMNKLFRPTLKKYSLIIENMKAHTDVKFFENFAMRFFENDINVYIEDGKGENFPLFEENTIYFALETFTGSLKIPVFGASARLKGASFDVSGILSYKNDFSVDIAAKYFAFEMLLEKLVLRLKENAVHSGYRIKAESLNTCNSVCYAGVFDVAAAISLTVGALLEVSSDKSASCFVERLESSCKFSVSVGYTAAVKEKRVKAKDIFGEEASRVIESVIEFCELFSFKFLLKTHKSRLEAVICLPIYNVRPAMFKNEELERFEKEINMAMLLLK